MFKWFKFSTVAILICSLCVFSCNDDEPTGPAPTMTLSDSRLDASSNYTANKGETVTIAVSIEAPGGFNLLRISYTGITRATEEVVRTEDGQTSFEYEYELENVQFEGDGFTITFLAVDNSNQTSSQDVRVDPEEPFIAFPESENTNITNDTLVVSALETVTVGVQVSAGAGFVKYTAEMPNPNGGFLFQRERTELPPTQGNSFIDRIDLTIPTEFEGEILRIDFAVDDEFGRQATAQLPVKVLAPDVKDLTAVLQAPSSDETSETFFSTQTGQSYSYQDLESDNSLISGIDFGYFYRSGDNASLTSPNAFPLSIYNLVVLGEELNVTLMAKTTLTETQYDELSTPQELIDTYEEFEDQAVFTLTDLAAGDILTFKTKSQNTEGNKFGLIQIGEIVPGDGSDGEINFEMKVIR